MITSVKEFKKEKLSSDQEALRIFYMTLSLKLKYDIIESCIILRPKPREILEFIVANVLERFGFRVETNKMAKTKDGRVIEVDVWGVKTIGNTRFYVYVSCKNWDKKVDRDVIFSEIGRISNLIQQPHLKIFVCKELTDSARETALTDGFTVIELREKANSKNIDEIAKIISNHLNNLFPGNASSELQRIAKDKVKDK